MTVVEDQIAVRDLVDALHQVRPNKSKWTSLRFGVVISNEDDGTTTVDLVPDDDTIDPIPGIRRLKGTVDVGSVVVMIRTGGDWIILGSLDDGLAATGSLAMDRSSVDSVTYTPGTNQETQTSWDVFPRNPSDDSDLGLSKMVSVPSWARKAFVIAKISNAWSISGVNSTNLALGLGTYNFRDLGAGVIEMDHIVWDSDDPPDAGHAGVGSDERQNIILSGLVDLPEVYWGTSQLLAVTAISAGAGRVRVDQFSPCSIEIIFFGQETLSLTAGPPGPPGPPGTGSFPCVDVTAFTPDTVVVGGITYPFKTAGRSLGDFNWLLEHVGGDGNKALGFNGLTALWNRQNYAANRIAIDAAWHHSTLGAKHTRLRLFYPLGHYAVPPARPGLFMWTETNDTAPFGFDFARTMLWHIGVTNAGVEEFGPVFHQRMIDGVTYWNKDTLDSGALGQPPMPHAEGFTINGTFARKTDDDGNTFDDAAGAAIGLWIGGGNHGYWNLKIVNYHGHTGPSEADGQNGGEAITGDIPVLYQNEPGARADGGNAYSEQNTFGTDFDIRKNYQGIVVDGQMNSSSSFKGTRFLSCFLDGSKCLQVINSAHLYDVHANFFGNVAGRVFRVGSGDTGDGKGSRITGYFNFEGETGDGSPGEDVTLITMEDHAWWFTHGRINLWTISGGAPKNDIPHPYRQFHHEGDFLGTGYGLHIAGWKILQGTADNGLALTQIDTNNARIKGRWTGTLQEGTKLRWEDDIQGEASPWESGHDYSAGDRVTVDGTKYKCINAHTSTTSGAHDAPPGNSDDWTASEPHYGRIKKTAPVVAVSFLWTKITLTASSDNFINPRPLSLRYSHQTPPDYGPGSSGEGGASSLIGGQDNDVTGTTTISGITSPFTPLVGPTLQLAYQNDELGPSEVINGTTLGALAFGGHDNGLKSYAAYMSAISTAGWDNSQNPAEFEFFATRQGHVNPEKIGRWGTQGLEVRPPGRIQSGGADPDGRVNTLLNIVRDLTINFDADVGNSISTQLGTYPRALLNVEGQHIWQRPPPQTGTLGPIFQNLTGYTDDLDATGDAGKHLYIPQGFVNGPTGLVWNRSEWVKDEGVTTANQPGAKATWGLGFWHGMILGTLVTGATLDQVQDVAGVAYAPWFGGVRAPIRLGWLFSEPDTEVVQLLGGTPFGGDVALSGTFQLWTQDDITGCPASGTITTVNDANKPVKITYTSRTVGSLSSFNGCVAVATPSSPGSLPTTGGNTTWLAVISAPDSSTNSFPNGGAYIDKQIAYPVGRTTPGGRNLLPLTGAVENYGLWGKVSGNHSVKQHMIHIEMGGTPGPLHAGIYNEAPLIQSGNADFAGSNVDFTGATVTGLAVDGVVYADGKTNYLEPTGLAVTDPNVDGHPIVSFAAIADFPSIRLWRQNGSILSPSALSNNNVLGQLAFAGQVSSGPSAGFAYLDSALIQAQAAQAFDALDHGTRLVFSVSPLSGSIGSGPVATFAIQPGTGIAAVGQTESFGNHQVDGTLIAMGAVLGFSSAGIGYSFGAGGTVVQGSNKSNPFTLNKICGTIKFAAGSLASRTTASAIWTNSAIGSTDIVIFMHISGGSIGSYDLTCTPAPGSATLRLTNITSAALNEQPVFAFAIIKASTV